MNKEMQMEFSLAPMEGLTGFIVRNAFYHNFNNIDKYYTPFIPFAMRMSKKIVRDICRENNEGINLIPQIMSNKAEEVLILEKQLADFGYDIMNINLGCPSGTVVSKKRGSGFLGQPEELDRFLDQVYSKANMKISIKSRVGLNDPEEWANLLAIYKKYPIDELIIHPRVRMDFYKGSPRYETFEMACQEIDTTKTKLCYNGDIVTAEDYKQVRELFPSVDKFMLGRGLLTNPGLIELLRLYDESGQVTSWSDDSREKTQDICGIMSEEEYKKVLRSFIDEIITEYIPRFQGEKEAVGHIKEIWSYLRYSFADSDKCWKKIRKSQNYLEYTMAVNQMFDLPLI